MNQTTQNTSRNAKSRSRRPESSPNGEEFNLAYGKVPPHANELEQAVLGACMLEVGAIHRVGDILHTDCFYHEKHQKIYRAMQGLATQSSSVDLLTVTQQLMKQGDLDNVGGPFYITQLTNAVISTANLETHARIVLEKFMKREVIRLGGEMISQAFDESVDSLDLLEFSSNDLFKIGSTNIRKSYSHIMELFHTQMRHIGNLMHRKEDITGVPSGFRTMDALTCGWQPTDLIIVAARPSVGKTAFALNLVRNAALHPRKPTGCLFFSLEMSKSQVVERMISMQSEVYLDQLRRGRISQGDFDQILRKCEGTIAKAPIYVDDTSAINIFELRSKARRAVNKSQIGLIIIDYLQLMSGSGERGNREQEISKISRDLKALAKDLQVPVIALSQLSRDVEKRASQDPVLSDLRESGAIEQDADMVMFLYRPDYQKEAGKVDPALAGQAFVKIAKHRNGAIDTLPFYTDFRRQLWMDQEQYDRRNEFPEFGPLRNYRDITEPQGAEDMPF